MFVKLAQGVSAGDDGALHRLRLLHQAIVDREEQGETLSRLLPGGLAEKLRQERRRIGETERVVVTVLMSDIRCYSAIAEHADPSQLAGQLNTHRAAMNHAILGQEGTVMQFVGDAVMAVFGAPFPQPTTRTAPWQRRSAMHALQAEINGRWQADGLPPFGLGLGLSTGEAAAALLGSAERLEYTLVGDTVNLSQRLAATGRPRRDCVVGGHVQGAANRRWRPPPSVRSGSRDATLRYTPTRSTRVGDMMSETDGRARAGRCAGCARPSRPRTRRSGRCGGWT